MTFEKQEAKAFEGPSTQFNGGDILSHANISDLAHPVANAAGLPSLQLNDSKGGSPSQVAEFFMNVGQSWGQAGTPGGNLATGPVIDGKWAPVRIYRPDGSIVAPLALPAPPKA
jgi:hypothetical protein